MCDQLIVVSDDQRDFCLVRIHGEFTNVKFFVDDLGRSPAVELQFPKLARRSLTLSVAKIVKLVAEI